MDVRTLKEHIAELFSVFFKDMGIDVQTGIVSGTDKRFSGYPYIGSNYVNAPIKILFIPLDTGIDECFKQNTYHSLEERERRILDLKFSFNAHIAGIYATSLYILKDTMDLQSSWEKLWVLRGAYKTAKAIKVAAESLPRNLMSYIAYENRYRFVTIGRGWNKNGNEMNERGGNKDRRWILAPRESKLLMAEIGILSPDIIIFQGKAGLWHCHVNELKKNYQVILSYHPSYWQGGADKLQYIVDEIAPQIRF